MFNRLRKAWALSGNVEVMRADKLYGVSNEKIVPITIDDLGDGNAEFLGEGSQEEFIQQQRIDAGIEPWYRRMARLGKTKEDYGTDS